MGKSLPAKRDPLLTGQEPLIADDEVEEDGYLTEEQEATIFMSRWQERVDPFVQYEEYFRSSAKSSGHILKEIRQFYIKLVVNGVWSDKKFVAVIDRLMQDSQYISAPSMDAVGRQYDRDRIRTQRRR